MHCKLFFYIIRQNRVAPLNFYFSFFRNIIHGSDSVESAEKEIALWFKSKDEVVDWNPAAYNHIYEN